MHLLARVSSDMFRLLAEEPEIFLYVVLAAAIAVAIKLFIWDKKFGKNNPEN